MYEYGRLKSIKWVTITMSHNPTNSSCLGHHTKSVKKCLKSFFTLQLRVIIQSSADVSSGRPCGRWERRPLLLALLSSSPRLKTPPTSPTKSILNLWYAWQSTNRSIARRICVGLFTPVSTWNYCFESNHNYLLSCIFHCGDLIFQRALHERWQLSEALTSRQNG